MGGSALSQWHEGEALFEAMLEKTKRAIELSNGTLAGMVSEILSKTEINNNYSIIVSAVVSR